jgi:hypothetical protein
MVAINNNLDRAVPPCHEGVAEEFAAAQRGNLTGQSGTEGATAPETLRYK